LAVAVTVMVVAVAAWLFVRYREVLVGEVLNSDPQGHVDFETFYRSSVALLQQRDSYHTGSRLYNLNPPLLAMLLIPFALIPQVSAYWVFTVVSALAMTSAVLLVARELRLAPGWRVVAVATLWSSSPMHGTLALGQIYGLLMLGLVVGWLALRRGHPEQSAVVLGTVVAVKPLLAALLLVPLFQFRFRALWVGLATLGACTVAGALVAGPDSTLEWLRLVIGTPAPEVAANASLPGMVARFGGPTVVGWALSVTVVVVSLWRVRGALPPPVSRAGSVGGSDAALFAVTAGCLLAAPVAWQNYVVLLWPGALMLVSAGRWRVGLPLLVLPGIPVTWEKLWEAEPHALVSLVALSLYCWVLLGYWGELLRSSAPGRPPAEGCA
jgi:arabinofuranan 3-O-arabinosyltransferase